MKDSSDLANKFSDLANKAQEIGKTSSISFLELFPASFMRTSTDFSSIDEFLEKSGFTISDQGDCGNASQEEMDKFVSQYTRFSTWKEMMQKALESSMIDRIGLA